MEKEFCFSAADILLPDFGKTDGEKWACIACDQFTSEPEYWNETESVVGSAPSSLRLVLPELYLGKEDEARIAKIHEAMDAYEKDVLKEHKNTMIYLRRLCPTGKVREGLVGKIDLDAYDYHKETTAPIRATEGTVLSRIPPRVRVRRGASLELPHVMLLVDDAENKLFSMLSAASDRLKMAYDFPLMQGGGAVSGYFIDEKTQNDVLSILCSLHEGQTEPLVFAVGDGNHSLATAKAYYEELKEKIGDAAKTHPARYALVEIVNIHSEALVFEPIYRVVFGADRADLLGALRTFAQTHKGEGGKQTLEIVYAENNKKCKEIFTFENAPHSLTVGTLQMFLDEYVDAHADAEVDYIHDVASLEALAVKPGAVGFLFEGMEKSELFPAVDRDGSLPRKTFSMGSAREKRYYLEARKIR